MTEQTPKAPKLTEAQQRMVVWAATVKANQADAAPRPAKVELPDTVQGFLDRFGGGDDQDEPEAAPAPQVDELL